MNEIKVSVIVPIYNASAFLRQTIDSILSQTLKQIEIICVDDGSKDDSLSILNGYADERIRVVSQENGGAGKARNTGLALAKGEYLSFLDADDFYEPDMLEKAYLKAKQDDSDIVVFRSDQYREDLDRFNEAKWTLRINDLPPYTPFDHRSFTDNVFKVFVGWAWDKLFKRTFVQKYGLSFQEIRSSNDMLFVFTAVVLAEKISVIDEVLYHQRRGNPDSISNTRERSWDNFYKALNALKENLIRFRLFEELRQDYINYCLHFSLWHLNTISGEKKKVLFHKLKNEWFKEFGIENKNKDYFYIRSEYLQYQLIRLLPFGLWVIARKVFQKLKKI